MDKSLTRETKIIELSRDILTTIKEKARIQDLTPEDAICALTSVYMGGFAALRTTPSGLKDLFQILLNDYAHNYEQGEHDEEQ